AVGAELEVGGGIRTESDIRKLLDLGITDVILGSVLVKSPTESHRWIRQFPGRIMAGIDAKDDIVRISGWTESGAVHVADLVGILNPLPLAGIVFTDIATDGMMAGPGLAALEKVAAVSEHPIIASGGVRNRADIQALIVLSPRITGCIVGKAVLSDLSVLETLFFKVS
ncbi:MAG: HisA/HisF-related TIM barrel protein, partial [Candidatus Margulisiibacteriota bacterium]